MRDISTYFTSESAPENKRRRSDSQIEDRPPTTEPEPHSSEFVSILVDETTDNTNFKVALIFYAKGGNDGAKGLGGEALQKRGVYDYLMNAFF